MNSFLQPVFLLCALGFHATAAETIIYGQIGEDIKLNLPPYTMKYYFHWHLNSKEIVSVNTYGKPTLSGGEEWKSRLIATSDFLLIKNLTQTDFNVFICIVKDRSKEITTLEFRLIQLNVAVEPLVLLPGETLSLNCATVGHTPQIHWDGPQGLRMKGSSTFQVSSQHSGEWTCVIGTGRRVQIKVTVIDLLPSPPNLTQYTSALDPLAIPCSLTADSTWDQVKSKGVREVGWNFCPARPQCDKSGPLLQLSLEGPTPKWKTLPHRAPRPSSDPSRGNMSLGRNLAREEDGGDYECFMKFQDVTLNRTVRVEVLRIIADPGTQLKIGQQLNLTCTTAHPLPPDLRIQWLPPTESSLLSSLDLGSPRLTFGSVQSFQNGTWRCQLLRGQTILTSAVVLLNIEQQWSVWKLVTLCAAAAILILLVILVVILQRRRQRRTRRHKRLCKCKNPKPKGFYRS